MVDVVKRYEAAIRRVSTIFPVDRTENRGRLRLTHSGVGVKGCCGVLVCSVLSA